MEPLEQCKVEWQLHPGKGWELKLTGDCGETLEQIEGLPPRKRQYLERRLVIEG